MSAFFLALQARGGIGHDDWHVFDTQVRPGLREYPSSARIADKRHRSKQVQSIIGVGGLATSAFIVAAAAERADVTTKLRTDCAQQSAARCPWFRCAGQRRSPIALNIRGAVRRGFELCRALDQSCQYDRTADALCRAMRSGLRPFLRTRN